MKKVMYKVLVGFIFLLVCAFQTDENKIYWSTKQLVWNDFKGKPNVGSKYNAVTDFNISVNAKSEKDSIVFDVRCFFNPMDSWVKEGSETDFLLKHEQGHFDIAEIYCRLLRKQLLEYKFSYRTIQEDYSKMNNANMDNCKKEQSLYDKETNHSTNKIKQTEWNKKIEKQLKELESFSENSVTVAFKR